MLISCPYCGPRDAAEFTYRGDATLVRPAPDASDDAWFDHVYLRDNPAGPHRELWFHRAGCHAWVTVERDTRTHAVAGVVLTADHAAGSGEGAR